MMDQTFTGYLNTFVFKVALPVLLYNVFAVVVLTLTAGDGGEQSSVGELAKKAARGVVTNPIIIGIAAGIAWSLLGLPMPVVLGSTVKNVAVLATPLDLIAMGASFDFRAPRGSVGIAAVATLIKLVVLVAISCP